MHAAGGDLADAQIRQARLRVDHVADQLVALPGAVAASEETKSGCDSCMGRKLETEVACSMHGLA